MKKKNLFILLIVLMMLLTGCGNGKTVKTKDEAKAMAEEFYKDLLTSDPITMETYYDGALSTEFTKDQDKMYVNQIEAGYDYYLFMEDGKKYLIADDRTLIENESMYDMSLDTLNMFLQMNILGFFEIEDESATFSATNKNDKELTLSVSMKDENNKEYVITSTGTKDDSGRVSSVTSQIEYDGQASKSEYKFSYDKTIELPEYTTPVTYDNMPHVDSPYKTFGEILNKYGEEDYLYTMVYENQLLVIDSVDGRHYQFSAQLSDDVLDAYNNIDYMEDDAQQQFYNLISNLEIEDCIDFTDAIISQEELDSYANKTIGELVSEGFEVGGYSFWEDQNYIDLMKDLMRYTAEVIPEEGFDLEGEFEYDDLSNFTIKGMKFLEPEYAALPMK